MFNFARAKLEKIVGYKTRFNLHNYLITGRTNRNSKYSYTNSLNPFKNYKTRPTETQMSALPL